MGFAITWCAVRKEYAQTLLRDLNLSLTSQTDDAPDSPVTAGELDTGWQILWFNEYDCAALKNGTLQRLSLGYEIIVCKIEEHVMASSSELWFKGEQVWQISHEADTNVTGVETAGRLPSCFAEIKAKLEHKQATGDPDVDYIFEIPLEVARHIVGFKHDEVCKHLVNRTFVVVTGYPKRQSLWKKLFS